MFRFAVLLSSIVFLLLDYMYLQLIYPYFSTQIADVQKTPMKINYLGMAFCYVFLLCGLHYFIILPKKSAHDAFLLGILIYGVYESTNYALFSNWSIMTVFIDTLWGGILFGLTTAIIQSTNIS